MRVLVIGGTGFIGGHAVGAFLARGDEVTVLTRDPSRARADGRLQGAQIVEGRAGALPRVPAQDVVVYAAGAWLPHDVSSATDAAARCQEIYVDGVAQLASAAREWDAHFIFMSGTSRYGLIESTPVTEDTPPAPLALFGVYKRQAEAVLASATGLRWTAVAPPECYGAGDRGSYLVFVYERVRARRFFLIGKGDNRWALCNVRNVADAIVAVAPGPGLGVLHIADEKPSSQRELAAAVATALGRTPRFLQVPRLLVLGAAAVGTWIPRVGPRLTPHKVRVRTCDILLDTSKATRLGIHSRRGLTEGVAEAVAWWEARRGEMPHHARHAGRSA